MRDLTPLLAPRSIAVVGATSRPGAYADETLRNLRRTGFRGRVWGVHPTRRRVHGRTCVPTVADLPEPVDAVVVAIPAAGVPEVIEQAGARGCGGAVVYAAGFGETPDGEGLEAALRTAADRHDLPVCGPNCDGIVAFHDRAALWGDALVPGEAGHVAVISQSGNVAVNALAARRGLRLHTVVSCGNQAVVDAGDWLHAIAQREGVRSVALFLESDGDGARLCEALALCADAGIGVAVLKVGASAAGASAAAAHTGAVAGDHAAFRALVQEAGAAWAHDVHDLLELAKALAVRRARPRGDGGLAILTCSGGDSGLGADEAQRLGLDLPALRPDTAERVRALLPAAATVANPLDYTAIIWGEVETLRDMIAAVGEDPGIDHVLAFYDQPHGLEGALRESWDAVREGIRAGAAASPVPTLVASTLPELLDDEAAWELAGADVAAVAGLRTALACAAALRQAAGRRRAPAGDRRGRGGRARRGSRAVARRGERQGAAGRRGHPRPARARRPRRGRRGRDLRAPGAPRRAQARRRRAAPQDRGRRRGAGARGRAQRALGLSRPRARERPLPAPTRGCSSRPWRRPGSSCSSARAATPSCPSSPSGWAASGPRPSATSPSSRCPPTPRASSARCAPCAPRRCWPARAPAPRSTSRPLPRSPRARARCCSTRASSCSSSTPCSSTPAAAVDALDRRAHHEQEPRRP